MKDIKEAMEANRIVINEEVLLDISTNPDWYICGFSYDQRSVSVEIRRKDSADKWLQALIG